MQPMTYYVLRTTALATSTITHYVLCTNVLHAAGSGWMRSGGKGRQPGLQETSETSPRRGRVAVVVVVVIVVAIVVVVVIIVVVIVLLLLLLGLVLVRVVVAVVVVVMAVVAMVLVQ